jgi:crotonobetainyl-CoA:carnitine CoA-transferase CaiB-like acyl-CoA transferase
MRPGTPFRFGTWPPAIERGPSPLGADNAAVLREAGLSPEVGALEEAGILATRPRRGPAQ